MFNLPFLFYYSFMWENCLGSLPSFIFYVGTSKTVAVFVSSYYIAFLSLGSFLIRNLYLWFLNLFYHIQLLLCIFDPFYEISTIYKNCVIVFTYKASSRSVQLRHSVIIFLFIFYSIAQYRIISSTDMEILFQQKLF